MKIAYGSDIHLEINARNFELVDADVLILAGDICLIDQLRLGYKDTKVGDWSRQFFIDVSAKYNKVIYIPGNHDYWESDLSHVVGIFYEFCYENGIKNINFNPFGAEMIDDVKFVFATLWTDYKNEDPLIMWDAKTYMNDFNWIMNYGKKLIPSDIYEQHILERKHFINECSGAEKIICISHHAPDMSCMDESRIDNVSYMYGCTDMIEIILDTPAIKFWVYGHTHIKNDMKIGSTRVLSNPRGYYPYEYEFEIFEI